MSIEDLERAAYISGDVERAALLARIADLEHTVARYECALEAIVEEVNTHSMTLKQCAGAAWEVLP
jgi:hypothetical protein